MLAASLVVIALAGWHFFYHSGSWKQLNLREVVCAEVVTLAAFLGAIWLRGFTPQMQNTEKPMDAAFLSSVILTDQMPPADPWMAGETINYYYIGYAIHGAIAKVAGIPSNLAFNLALATTTAIAIAAAVGCALIIAPRYARIVGPMAAFLAVIAGNMEGPYRLLRQGREAWDASWWSGMGWQSSRVVYDGTIQTINEFPAFSIILGDLHPHLMALPFTILALGVAFGILRSSAQIGWIRLALIGVLGGSLYGLNSWDFPTYFGLILLALLWHYRSEGARIVLTRLVGVIAIAIVAWSPFFITFTPFVAGNPDALPSWLRDVPLVGTGLTTVSVNNFEFTAAGEFLRVFGLFYIIIVASLIAAAVREGRSLQRNDSSSMIAVPLALLVIVALLGNAPVFILIGIPAALAVMVVRKAGPASATGAISLLFLAGALIIALTELFFIQDAFHNRMNTLFKAYYQVWTLWGIGAAVGLGWMLAEARRPSWRVVVHVAIASSLVLGLIYPVVSAARWTDEFSNRTGLDGAAFVARFSEDEAAGIAFIRDHASPESVLLEAPGCSYQPVSQIPFNRVSAYTGVPTVLGWPNHEGQWRSGDDALRSQIGPRQREAQQFYESPSAEFLERYNIEFVYYGIYERGDGEDACDWARALPKPDRAVMSGLGFEVVFEQGDVTIWQRTT
jgi:YYY domain-containing protein